MPATFSMPPDQAYRNVLGVRAAGQRWFSFDVPIGEARKGHATRFGMTLWNFHALEGKGFDSWAITRDPATGDFWYRVAKERGKEPQPNRKLLWEALQIAARMPIPMRGILKDGYKRWCDPKYVFGISDVQMQVDGSALWLKLEVAGSDVGTEFKEEPLPSMRPVPSLESAVATRAARLPIDHYVAVRDAAIRVTFEGLPRAETIRALAVDPGLTEGTAGALLNNFRCLVNGTTFKAPMQALGMQLFIDAIVARLGDSALPKLIAAVEGYVDYAATAWSHPSKEIMSILIELQNAQSQAKMLKGLAHAAESAAKASEDAQAPSEILREVWVRGPQHAAFRRELLARWAGRCSVHGASCNGQLRASHIVAWAQDPTIRGDINNGLLLSVPLDSLFDRGLISFDNAGHLIRSDKLDADTIEHFGLRAGLRIAWDHLKDHQRKALRENLIRHRKQHKEMGFPD